MDILVFTVESERYALLARDVDQVVRSVAITDLPGAPIVVEGIIDVRGTIVPVLDIRRRFDLPQRAPVLSDLLIIASAGSRRVALRANASASIQQIDPDALLDRPEDTLRQSRYVAGLARLPDGMVVIHDLGGFLSEAESESLARALSDKEAQRVA